jgi:hypothetical protein
MTNDLETMLRGSLRDRADDVEPTPELWRRVERRVARRRTLPLFVWAAAGTAAVVAAVAVVPGILDGTESRLTIGPATEPPGREAPAAGAPGPEAPVESQLVPSGTASHYVAVSDGRLVLRSVDGSSETTLYDPPAEGESQVATLAVRPGSSPDDLTIAYVTSGEGMYDLRLLRTHDGGEVRTDVVTGNISPGAPGGPERAPTPVWSPDGRTMAWAAVDTDGDPALNLVELDDHLANAGAADRGGATELTAAQVYALSGRTEASRLRLQDCAVSAGTCGGLRVQDWAATSDGGRLSFTSEGLLLRTGIERRGDEWRLEDDGVLTAVEDGTYVVDLATASDGGAYVLTAGGSTSKDAEDAGLTVSFGDQSVGFPELHTAAPADAWMTAVDGGALLGVGAEARLVQRTDDGLVTGPVESATSYAAFVPVPARSGDTAPPATVEPPEEEAAPSLRVEDGAAVLHAADGAAGEVLYPDASVSPEAAVSVTDRRVRPGATGVDLTAVLLLATEGGPEYVALRLVDGEVEVTPFPGHLGIGTDADYGALQAPVWSPDGRHLAWTERSASDGSVTLRTIGWDDGPGTGRPVDDNASFELDTGGEDLVVADWSWEATDEDGTATGQLLLRPRDGASVRPFGLPVERQGDGALAVTGGPEEVDPAAT